MKCLPIRHWLICSLLLVSGMASAADQVVLAIPARHDLVNLGFDFVSMFPRSMNLVCYSGSGESLSLERFDAVAGRWLRLEPASWATASGDALVLVGEGAAVPQLRSSAVWAKQASVVGGARLHEVANAVNGFLRMSPAQWRRLADTHGFTLLDRNADARRYGRYGPPGGRRTPASQPMPAGADIDIVVPAAPAAPAAPATNAAPTAPAAPAATAVPAAPAAPTLPVATAAIAAPTAPAAPAVPAATAAAAASSAPAAPAVPAVPVVPADVRPEDK